MKRHRILIGFMGAGKTSVGKCLAALTGLPLLDTDDLIVAEAGMPITQIFKEQGEEGFRRMESRVLTGLLEREEPCVISVGGGLPLREENREILSRLGTVIFLRVRGGTVLARLAGDATRPMLMAPNKEERVRELLCFRNPIYELAANIILDADDKTPEELARTINAML